MNYPFRSPAKAEVVSVPGILGGMPIIAGTRVPAETIRVSLNAGESRYDIFSDYPSLSVGAIEAVIAWARENGLDVKVPE